MGPLKRFDRTTPGAPFRRSRWALPLVVLGATLLGVCSLAASRANAAPTSAAIPDEELCQFHWTIGEAWLPYCRTERLGEPRDEVTRAIVVVHGKRRNARSYFETVKRLAAEEGLGKETLIFALQFLTPTDKRARALPEQYLTWSRDGWKHGLKSTNGEKISSFEVLDRLLSRLIQQNPNLRQITIAGHSAGGQFAQRHALGRRLDLSDWKGDLHYVVTNAGSYMYLTPERPVPPRGCKSSYNDYRYGYNDNRLDYFQGTSPDSLWTKLASARVSILLGERDTDTTDIDKSCAALSQGKNRLERGKSFHHLTIKHLPSHLSPSDLARFQLHVIPGIGHDFARMWDSHCGRQLVFGDGKCVAAPPPSAAFPL